MFLVRVLRFTLIVIAFITVYLPITINPKFFARIQRGSVSYIVENDSDSVWTIDY